MLEEAIFGLLVPKLQGSLESKKIRERILGCSMTAGSRPLHHEQNSKLRGGAAEKLHLQTKKEKKHIKPLWQIFFVILCTKFGGLRRYVIREIHTHILPFGR